MDSEQGLNPTMLAKDCGIRHTKVGEGDGRLMSWEKFWELVEQMYWENRTKLHLERKRVA